MTRLARPIVALMGLMSIGMALALWFAMDGVLPRLGIAPSDLASGLVGRATVRADIAGLFGGMGLAMLIAAQRLSRNWTNAVLIFASTAIAGRIVSLILDGAPAVVWPPIAIEAIAIAVLLWFRSSLPAGRL